MRTACPVHPPFDRADNIWWFNIIKTKSKVGNRKMHKNNNNNVLELFPATINWGIFRQLSI
jgi:hypothetical protein